MGKVQNREHHIFDHFEPKSTVGFLTTQRGRGEAEEKNVMLPNNHIIVCLLELFSKQTKLEHNTAYLEAQV